MSKSLAIAVVGHTNVGKTSLLRTLLREQMFGEVSELPSTTRNVRSAQLDMDDAYRLTFFDTPGLEQSQALYKQLEELKQRRQFEHDGKALIEWFLQQESARQEFEQEAKVLNQLLQSDVALFVIDARVPVLPKYLDELAIVRLSATPIIPVLNFVEPNTSLEHWQEALKRVSLHHYVVFDALVPHVDAEKELYQQCAAVLPIVRPHFEALATHRQRELKEQRRAACGWIAETLINVASYEYEVSAELLKNQAVGTAREVISTQRKVRQAEHDCTQGILSIYGFTKDDAALAKLPMSGQGWLLDPFDTEALKTFGIKAAKGVGAGAAGGAAVDLSVGGASLGLFTAAGAAVGGAYQAWKRWRPLIQSQLNKKVRFKVEQEVVSVILVRQTLLVQALAARSHASLLPVELAEVNDQSVLKIPPVLHDALKKVARHPEWSALCAPRRLENSTSRERTRKEIQQYIEQWIAFKLNDL